MTDPQTTNAPEATGRGATPPALRAVGLTAALGAVLVMLLGLFILPSLKSGPHKLPLGVVASQTESANLSDHLDQQRPGAFEVAPFASTEALDAAIRDREVVGGLVMTPVSIDAHVASAGSTVISGTITALAATVADASQLETSTLDLVALPSDDPTGVGIGGLAFPLVFGGIVPVVAFASLFKSSHSWRLTGIIGFSVVGGVIVSAVLQFWFGSTVGVFWPVAGAMALGIAGLALPLSGLQQLFGAKGFTAGAMVMMFLGNPLAGIATTGAWLPSGLGAFGQILPPGATGSLVRSVAYFDGTGAATGLSTLLLWIAAGVVMNLIGIRRSASSGIPVQDVNAATAA